MVHSLTYYVQARDFGPIHLFTTRKWRQNRSSVVAEWKICTSVVMQRTHPRVGIVRIQGLKHAQGTESIEQAFPEHGVESIAVRALVRERIGQAGI